jgi:hypothetical protein
MPVDYINTAAGAAANNRVLRRGAVGVTSDTGVMKVGDGVTAWNSLPAVGGGGSSAVDLVPPFTYSGTLAVVNPGTARWYNETGRTLTVSKVRASVGTAPTGSSITVDVRKNGTTMFTGGTDRPVITAGTNTDTGIPAVTSIASGDYLTVDVVAVGSTVAGADLTVQVVAA